MEKITREDIAKIKCGSEITLSPSGNSACYVVTTPDLEKNKYFHDIHWIDLKTGQDKQLTHDGKESSFIYDDANTLLFASNRDSDDKKKWWKEKTCFYRLPLDGGEAYKAFEIEANVVAIKKIETGIYALKVLVDWNLPDDTKISQEECEEEKDYHIFEEAPFWGNGRGFISGKRTALYIYNESSKVFLRVTDKYTSLLSWVVKDGLIGYVARTYDELITPYTSLNLYDVKKKKNKVLVKQGLYRIGSIDFYKNGLIYLASDLKIWGSGQLDDFYFYNLKTRKSTLVYQNKEELAIGDSPLADTFFGGGTTFKVVDDKIYFKAMHKFENVIYSLDSEYQLHSEVALSGSIGCFDINGSQIVFIGSEADSLNCVYTSCKHEICKVYDLNLGFLDNKYVANCNHFTFNNTNGDTLDGWILKPFNYSPKKKYPGLLEIHGGPRCAYGEAFFHEMQTYASAGYFVFYTNPRGSEGYGEQFADLRGKYGTIDYQDLMEFVDEVLDMYPQIDRNRIGCLGGSYGGFMCNWIEGHTDRFKAIASQRSVSNWVADFGSSEIGVTFDSNEMAATPWSDMEKMWTQSPLKYANNAKTPILFIHSLCDYNCPLEQGIEMFTAMKYFHVDSKMVVFEGENHSLSRSGKPKHRVRRLKEMNDWFDKYLK